MHSIRIRKIAMSTQVGDVTDADFSDLFCEFPDGNFKTEACISIFHRPSVFVWTLFRSPAKNYSKKHSEYFGHMAKSVKAN